MNSAMHLKILLNAKHLVTKFTLKRTLSSMGSVVTNLQEKIIIRLQEKFNIANESLKATRTSQMFALY